MLNNFDLMKKPLIIEGKMSEFIKNNKNLFKLSDLDDFCDLDKVSIFLLLIYSCNENDTLSKNLELFSNTETEFIQKYKFYETNLRYVNKTSSIEEVLLFRLLKQYYTYIKYE